MAGPTHEFFSFMDRRWDIGSNDTAELPPGVRRTGWSLEWLSKHQFLVGIVATIALILIQVGIIIVLIKASKQTTRAEGSAKNPFALVFGGKGSVVVVARI